MNLAPSQTSLLNAVKISRCCQALPNPTVLLHYRSKGTDIVSSHLISLAGWNWCNSCLPLQLTFILCYVQALP